MDKHVIMFLKKTNDILNRLLIFIPLLLIISPFLNGVGCNAWIKGQATFPQRDIVMTCTNGIYDIYNYFPDGSIRSHKGLFGYFMGSGVLIQLTHDFINYDLPVELLKKDAINQTGNFFKFNFKKIDKENINVDYQYDFTDADSNIRIKARYSGELGFIE